MNGATPPKRGRPPVPDDQRRTETRRARLTPEQAAKWDRLGGADWMRDRLNRAREPK